MQAMAPIGGPEKDIGMRHLHAVVGSMKDAEGETNKRLAK